MFITSFQMLSGLLSYNIATKNCDHRSPESLSQVGSFFTSVQSSNTCITQLCFRVLCHDWFLWHKLCHCCQVCGVHVCAACLGKRKHELSVLQHSYTWEDPSCRPAQCYHWATTALLPEPAKESPFSAAETATISAWPHASPSLQDLTDHVFCPQNEGFGTRMLDLLLFLQRGFSGFLDRTTDASLKTTEKLWLEGNFGGYTVKLKYHYQVTIPGLLCQDES